MKRRESVDDLRKKIDQVDEKIVELLSQRASLAQAIGRTKSLGSEEVFVPSREKEIFQRLSKLNRGPLPEKSIHAVYREILSASRSLEAPLRIAYLGPEATFTHLAARERFGSSTTFIPAASIPEVFQEVSQRRANYGVVPIENSTEGAVTHTLDLLVEAEVKICAEAYLDIHLYLLSRSGKAANIRKIVSHPQALAQCRGWLTSHLPKIPVEEVSSTAHAAELAAADPNLAAVSSRLAKELYGLEAVEENVEDNANNITRFLVIGNQTTKPSGDDKTSLVFSVKDEVGVLHRMLDPFAKNRINLTKIESRPLKNKPWEYLFFLDLRGHVKEPRVQRAIQKLEKRCLFMKILGSYPCAV
ncbi:MAG: chorismate mutase [Deltaproteobacteria bacterium RIFCSPLOWO2_12_FULL_60_19]|nr:MAG: chorismate mutase [Deltaproteobacteria bacterium RIFCSPLOWO2_12_FULL_60_19]